MKTKIVFLDHADHLKTNSSRFFSSILERKFEIEYVYLNPAEPVDPKMFKFESGIDRVVIWQMDYLAPITLAAGLPTIVVPMYDGSALMPDLHWQWSKSAWFLNFSRRLHDRIGALGNHSMLVKYFPAPVEERKKANFSHGLRALLWERRPEDGIDIDMVHRLFGSQLKSLHVHEVPDIKGRVRKPGKSARDYPFRITKSSWFRSQSDFFDLMDKCNVFVCPRCSEGIGMAMLEAMARGMLVVGHDDATHDEYIANWINGVLFHRSNVGEANFDSARELGDLAWHGAVDGYEKWRAKESEIVDFIASAPRPAHPEEMPERFIKDLTVSYFNGLKSYERFLVRNVPAIAKMSGLSEEQLLGEYTFDPEPKDGAAFNKGQVPTVLRHGLISFTGEHNPYVEKGWSNAEEGWRWMEGKSASLTFSLLAADTGFTSLTFRGRTLKELGKSVKVCFVLNNVVLEFVTLTAYWSSYSVPIPTGTLGVKNRLQIYASNSGSPNGDRRDLSVAFVSIEMF